ncbi:MAG: restriction endonuclease [Chloroflexota bacterium]|nr:restriction endonuclease [Chloroflexota bacterium]
MSDPLTEYEDKFRDGTLQKRVFQVIKDMRWHCRKCEYDHVDSGQLAGGGGFQGLKRGSGSRAGLILESEDRFCYDCDRVTRQDRWTGEFQSSVNTGSMPDEFIDTVMRVFGSRDVIENTMRRVHELTIDHKLPMKRWNPESNAILTDYRNMDETEIKDHFQLLKKSNGAVSHNMLKSRACEHCFATGERGKPFGIDFFYSGGPLWLPADKRDPNGCIGCGWYDFAVWRDRLNQVLAEI